MSERRPWKTKIRPRSDPWRRKNYGWRAAATNTSQRPSVARGLDPFILFLLFLVPFCVPFLVIVQCFLHPFFEHEISIDFVISLWVDLGVTSYISLNFPFVRSPCNAFKFNYIYDRFALFSLFPLPLPLFFA